MKNALLIAILSASYSLWAATIDYGKLLDEVRILSAQETPSISTNSYIFECGKLFNQVSQKENEELVSRCILMFGLSAGLNKNGTLYRASLASFRSKFDQTEICQKYDLVPDTSVTETTCYQCDGTGKVLEGEKHRNTKCERCNGTGTCSACKGASATSTVVIRDSDTIIHSGGPTTPHRVGRASRPRVITRSPSCSVCNGSGLCKECNGKGTITKLESTASRKTCPECRGTGKVKYGEGKKFTYDDCSKLFYRVVTDITDVLAKTLSCEKEFSAFFSKEFTTSSEEEYYQLRDKFEHVALNFDAVGYDRKFNKKKADFDEKRRKEDEAKERERKEKADLRNLLNEIENVRNPQAALDMLNDFVKKSGENPFFPEVEDKVGQLRTKLQYDLHKARKRNMILNCIYGFIGIFAVAYFIMFIRLNSARHKSDTEFSDSNGK